MRRAVFVLQGNHEEYTGEIQEWSDFVTERGFTVLRVRVPLYGTRRYGNVLWHDLSPIKYAKNKAKLGRIKLVGSHLWCVYREKDYVNYPGSRSFVP